MINILKLMYEDEEDETKKLALAKAIDALQNVERNNSILERLTTDKIINTIGQLINVTNEGKIYFIDNKVLNLPIHIYEDDGTGLGIFNKWATSLYKDHNELKVWI